MALRSAQNCWISGETILGLGHANRQMAKARLLPTAQFGQRGFVEHDLSGPIDLLGDCFDLLAQWQGVFIERLKARGVSLHQFDNSLGQILCACTSVCPMSAQDCSATMSGNERLYRSNLIGRILHEMIDRDERWYAKASEVLQMLAEIGATPDQRVDVGSTKVWFRHPTVHLQGADGGNHNHRFGAEACLAALDVEEFLCAQIGPKACFGDHKVC